MICAHLSESDRACGRPTVAVWHHPVLGEWPVCQRHHRAALAAVARLRSEWTHEDATRGAQEGQGAPEALGAA